MPSIVVLEFLSELRSLPVPWVAQVAEQAAWSVEESNETDEQPDNVARQAAMEFRAILDALKQEIASLKKLTPAIGEALRFITAGAGREPSIAFSFPPAGEILGASEAPDPFSSLRTQSFVNLSEEKIGRDNRLLDNLFSALRIDIEDRLDKLPGPDGPDQDDHGARSKGPD